MRVSPVPRYLEATTDHHGLLDTWALHDITNGSNPGCFTDGFQAVEGWDPVTGLGTPDYPALLRLFMGLQ